MRVFSKAPDGTTHVRLWYSPYNGGWIWFDRKQLKRFASGWRRQTLWWCLFGVCGRLTLQSTPWGKDPGERARTTVRNTVERSQQKDADQ